MAYVNRKRLMKTINGTQIIEKDTHRMIQSNDIIGVVLHVL